MTNLVKHGFNQEQISLIKSTIMSGKTPPTDNDLALFGMVCQRTGLDPFSKQIYAIERKGRWTFQVGIDGLRSIAERTGQYAGSDEPLFDEGLTQYECDKQGRKLPSVCKVTVYKMVQGVRCPFVGIARYLEYVQEFNGKPSDTWAKMPFTMLSKCAESQALRKAFPKVAEVESQAIPAQPEDDSWRIAGYEWGIKQGIPPEIANAICTNATDKKQLFAAMQDAIPAPQTVIEAEVF